jgi:hypothetical protein
VATKDAAAFSEEYIIIEAKLKDFIQTNKFSQAPELRYVII